MSADTISKDRIQKHAKALTDYVQSVHDLSVTPLFAEGHPTPCVNFAHRTDGELERVEFSVADPYVVRGALIPFRKLWLENELTSYYKIAKILKAHHANARWYVDFLRDRYATAYNSTFPWRIAEAGVSVRAENPLPACDIINLWLNSRLFHSGDKSRFQFKFSDFERERERIGHAKFEFLFNASIYELGIQSTNLMRLAQYALNRFRDKYADITSTLDVVATPGIEEFVDGTVIRRMSPGITPDPQSSGEKLALLRRENSLHSLNRALKMIGDDNELLARGILQSDTFESLLAVAGLKLVSRMPSLNEDDSPIQDEVSDLQDEPQRTDGASSCVRKDMEFWTSNVTALDGQLNLAKKQLVSRQGWIPAPQPLWKRAVAMYGVPFPYSDG